MLEDLNQRLVVAKANIRARDKLRSKLKAVRESLASANSRRKTLKKTLQKEQSDVDALEGISVTGLFHFVLGTKEQRLEKERQELVAAKLKYEQASDTAENLTEEVQRLHDALSKLENADEQFEKVLGEKEELLAATDNEIARSLIDLSQQIADLTTDKHELAEAVLAGNAALKSVQAIAGTLDSAANWGAFDMIGGGMLTTLAKHSQMDAAKNQAKSAQRKLLRFQEELADADKRLQLSLEFGGFATFADFFFDGLLADWVMQSRIQKAKSQCNKMIIQVKSAIRHCERRLHAVESEAVELREQKNALIETS